MYSLLLALLITPSIFVSAQEKEEWSIGQVVQTTSGDIQGHASNLIPEVSEYLGIPYAKAPIGSLRWAAPQSYVGKGKQVVASKFSDDCPANAMPMPSGKVNPALEKLQNILGRVGDRVMSEDCLSVNVWTMGKGGDEKRGKAVLLWIHGGGFMYGSSSTEIYNGARIAGENDVVVVSINYRLNIFGFPGAPGLPDSNFGILDQRMAIEWTRDNIAAFGGDPSRITLFGQSAGGMSADMHAYAWPEDPIVNAYIPQSGAAGVVTLHRDPAKATQPWFRISSKLGCGGPEAAEATVQCMRKKDYKAILDAMQGKKKSGRAILDMDFVPVTDEKVVFEDYRALAEAGKFAKKPLLVGTTDNEVGLFDVLSQAATGKGMSRLEQFVFNRVMTCPSLYATQGRVAQNISTYRYRYHGDYPNLRIGSKSGAYHGSELALIFGVSEKITGIKDTDTEAKVGTLLRKAWSTFAKNPKDGLTSELGWPHYDPSGYTLIRLGLNDETEASFGRSHMNDFGCGIGHRLAKYFGGPASGEEDEKDEL